VNCNATSTDSGFDGAFHEPIPIATTVAERLAVAVLSAGTTIGDTVLSLHCDPFDPLSPADNLIAYDDDGGEGLLSAFTGDDAIALDPGTTYWLVLSTFATGDSGDYEICFLGEFGVDTDADGVPDHADICPGGDDNVDGDGDGVPDFCDPCPIDSPDDSDGDGACDSDDDCPNDSGKTAPGICGCGVSDDDTDGDGTLDCFDQCPDDPAKLDPGSCGCGVSDDDTDGDGLVDCADNCADTPNPDQADTDGNGVGDACDAPPAGQPGACGCGAGSILMMPAMLLAIGWTRRRTSRRHRARWATGHLS
jgi:hypothetical protein